MSRPRDVTTEPLVRVEREIYQQLDEELARTFI
jgi:hypothetical protein